MPPFITSDIITPAEADALMQPLERSPGFAPNSSMMFGMNLDMLESVVKKLDYFMQHPTLGMPLLAMIRLLVMHQADCEYCTGLNEGILAASGLPIEDVRAAYIDPEKAPLDDKNKALLLLVLKAVNNPNRISGKDIKAVKAKGWRVLDIFDAVSHGTNQLANKDMLRNMASGAQFV